MASAFATSNDKVTSGCMRPTRNPSLEAPARFQRIAKAPGSKKLVHGQWVVVQPGDEDAE
jgi:hypothetical protein